jgi:hypothetical protein
LKLLEQLNGGSGTNAGSAPDLSELLGQLGAENPMARMLSEHLAQQEASRRSAAPVIDVAGEVTPDSPPPDDGAGREQAASDAATSAILELKSQAEAMFEELQVLRERNEELAWALGACPLCWGKDATCRSCRGRGRPGFCFPDSRGFLAYVLPAARMWRLKKQDEHATQQRRASSSEAKGEVYARNGQQR